MLLSPPTRARGEPSHEESPQRGARGAPSQGRSPQRGARGAPSHEDPDVYPPGTPRLQGLKLVDGEYRPLKSRLVDGRRAIRSEVLGLDVRVEDELLRFRDVATGRDIRHRGEIEADEERVQAQLRQEAAQRKAAEARIAELEAALRLYEGGPSL